jgi:hypothetical protein
MAQQDGKYNSFFKKIISQLYIIFRKTAVLFSEIVGKLVENCG